MKPTLGQLSALTLLLLFLGLAGLLTLIIRASEESVLRASELVEHVDETARDTQSKIYNFMSEVQQLVNDDELVELKGDALLQHLRESVESHEDIAEFTVTEADSGHQRTVLRARDGELILRLVHPSLRGFLAQEQWLKTGQKYQDEVGDPREHPTYTTLTRRKYRGRPLWSDLHYSQLDSGRVEVSLQKALLDDDGNLVSVVRVGRWTQQLDRIGSFTPSRTVFLCDPEGRLVTRLHAEDKIVEQGNDLRVQPTEMPPRIQAAMEALKQQHLGPDNTSYITRVQAGGAGWVAAFRVIPDTRDWVVGIVVPESSFLGPLWAVRSRLILVTLLLLLVLAGAISLVLRWLQGDMRLLRGVAARIKALDFSGSHSPLRLQDVEEVAQSFEGAKATLRAMSKYVPIDLVHQLFDRQIEPQLGGQLRRLTLMFTDVAGFTTTAEKMEINELAERLGEYLSRMAGPIHEFEGAMLERVGDGLLNVWNAPTPVKDHARKACLAALGCREATAHLGWQTRFGLHTDEVMVGHFGSPERLNYGILGDGVNLAARIEGLNKQYGTSILVTRAVVDEVGSGMEFRRVDIVAVKGRERGIELFELLGETGKVPAAVLANRNLYEAALAQYMRRDFVGAAMRFDALPTDHTAAIMARRCRAYLLDPPPDYWDGVYVATSK